MYLEDIVTRPEHNAYIILGNSPASIQLKGVSCIQTEGELGVDDVRWLHEHLSQVIPSGETRKTLFSVQGMTPQAQNALLKVVEEMQAGDHLFLLAPSGTRVLETLLSRCYLIRLPEEAEEVHSFLAMSPKERLQHLDTVWEKGGSERRLDILQLLNSLETHMHNHISSDYQGADSHTNDTRIAVQNLRDAMHSGGLHKATLQAIAFV